VRKTLWDKRLVGVIIESRKLKNLDFVSIFQTVSRFCYNALPNLISQYTKNRSNVLILVGIVSAKYKNYKKQDNVGYYGYLCYPDIDWTDKETFFEKS
jgi:hypothetical protein